MSTMIRFQWQPMSFNHILEQRFASSESQTCMIVIKLVFGNKNKIKSPLQVGRAGDKRR